MSRPYEPAARRPAIGVSRQGRGAAVASRGCSGGSPRYLRREGRDIRTGQVGEGSGARASTDACALARGGSGRGGWSGYLPAVGGDGRGSRVGSALWAASGFPLGPPAGGWRGRWWAVPGGPYAEGGARWRPPVPPSRLVRMAGRNCLPTTRHRASIRGRSFEVARTWRGKRSYLSFQPPP